MKIMKSVDGLQKLVCILYNFYNCLLTEHGKIQSYDEKGRSKCYYSHILQECKTYGPWGGGGGGGGGGVKRMYVSYITFITSAYKA